MKLLTRLALTVFAVSSLADCTRPIFRVRTRLYLGFHKKAHEEPHVPSNDHAATALRSLFAKRHFVSDFVFHNTEAIVKALTQGCARNCLEVAARAC